MSSGLDDLIKQKIKETEEKLKQYKTSVNELRFLLDLKELINKTKGESNEKSIY